MLQLSLSMRACMGGLLVAVAVFSLTTALRGAAQMVDAQGLQWLLGPWDSGEEATVPTWFSSGLLGANGLAAALIATSVGRRTRDGRWWLLLFAFLTLLSIDEVARFHERTIEPLRDSLGATGLLYYTWVIPGFLIVAAGGALMFRFWTRLPTTTRFGMVAAALLYFGGALVLEMVSGLLRTRYGVGLATAGTSIVEEALEMLGSTVLLWVLLDHLRQTTPTLRLALRR